VTVEYLTALTTIVSQGLLPRAKFMKIMLFNLLATYLHLCVVLAIFYAVKAQEHTLLERAAELSTLRVNIGAIAQQ
jgi:hypothetical protein